ncbi:MAG: FkbM family methyltransferase [Alphaproteobacteria bacterium]
MRKPLSLDRDTEVVDIEMGPAEGPAPYAALFAEGDCRLTRFEPALVVDDFPKARPNERFLPYLVGDGKDHTLHMCAHPGLNSLLEPNPAVLALYSDLQRNAAVTRKVEALRTRRLDDISEIKIIDLLKVNMQGGELAVLRGGRQVLARAVAVHVDVTFVRLYKGQPASGDIDLELRRLGLVLHHFVTAKRFVMAASAASYHNESPSSQLINGEALYLRDLSRHDLMDDEQLKHLAVICHHYAAFDEARFCMGVLEKRRSIPKDTVLRYNEWLAG